MTKLKWDRNGPLDMEVAKTPLGEYICSRTYLDVAVLKFNGDELRRSGNDGSHEVNREIAQYHHNAITARNNALREALELTDNDYAVSCPSCSEVLRKILALIEGDTND